MASGHITGHMIGNQTLNSGYTINNDKEDPNDNIDAETHFYGNSALSCNYYTEDQFNTSMEVLHKMKIIHLNCRSLYANFEQIKDFLMDFKTPFEIVALSETWINENKGMDFHLVGYNLINVNRYGSVMFCVEGMGNSSVRYLPQVQLNTRWLRAYLTSARMMEDNEMVACIAK